ncbi:hypothetical protein CQZ93_17925 [Ochrobactrum vermis]|nr:hypothetical protein CQZ93_17925 [Ochrobactrum vermis]
MRFRFIDQAKKEFPASRLCHVMGVSQSGYFSWKDRAASRRQRDDLVMLAHMRTAWSLSNETYGSPRMTRELLDQGFDVGRRRIARLMRENAMHARQKRRFKKTTDSHHAFPVAPNIIAQDFAATGPNQKWGADISYRCASPQLGRYMTGMQRRKEELKICLPSAVRGREPKRR